MNKIFDCFSYWDEDLLLDLRLHLLNNIVDYFVIVESNKTWQNNYKELKFNINKFKKFKNKILYIPVTDMPDGPNPWEREHFQRNCIIRGLKNSKDDYFIIISDADEIPNPKKITDSSEFCHITNLPPASWHDFRIRAHNAVGYSEWSEASDKVRTADAPYLGTFLKFCSFFF